jgi:hypothetical protein
MDDPRWSKVFALVDWHTLLLGSDGRLQWETLVTGILAIASAMLTVWFLHRQIGHADLNAKEQRDQTAKLAEEQRERRARAARAMLPVALEGLAQYAIACVAGLWGLRPYFPGDGWLNLSQAGKLPPVWALPSLAEYVLSVIKECIEFFDPNPIEAPGPADAPGRADALADLMRRFQAQNTQTRWHLATINGPDRGSQLSWNVMKEVIIESAELAALSRHLISGIKTKPFASTGIDGIDILSLLFESRCFGDDDIDEAKALTAQWERWPEWHKRAGATREGE